MSDDADPAHEEVEDSKPGSVGRTAAPGWIDKIASALRFGATFLTTVTVAIVVIAFAQDEWTGDYVIEPISRSSQLKDVLPNDAEIAAQLRERISIAWSDVTNKTVIKPIITDEQEPKFRIAGSDLSIRYLVAMLRRLVGKPITSITGVVLPADSRSVSSTAKSPGSDTDTVRIILRSSGSAAGPYFDRTGRFDVLLAKAATATLAQIDKYAAAGAMSQGDYPDRQRALMLVREGLVEEGRKRALSGWSRWYARDEMPRAKLTEANVVLKLGDYKSAIDLFRTANDLFKKNDPKGRDWYAAYDGLATMYLVQKDFDQARRDVATAWELARTEAEGSASVSYHRVEIEDDFARESYGGQARDACRAEVTSQTALDGYARFIEAHPGFTVAYMQSAALRRVRLAWMNKVGSRKCDGTPFSKAELVEATSTTERALVLASILDSDDSQSWFQLGNYYADQLRVPDVSGSDRSRTLELAIRNYRRSLALNKDDPYVLFHLAKVVVEHGRGALEQDVYDALSAEASTSLCRAKSLSEPYPDLSESIGGLVGSLTSGMTGCLGRGEGLSSLKASVDGN